MTSSGHDVSVQLDVDNTTISTKPNLPEIVTINPLDENFNYCYFVHDYSNNTKVSPTGKAQVEYVDDSVQIFKETTKHSGKFWHVFNIINKQLIVINKTTNNEPSLTSTY